VRELPFEDRAVDALPDALREAIARHWQRRARSEARIGRAFALMVPRVRAVGAVAAVRELLARAADDEARHAGICLRLASHYAGRDIAALDDRDVRLPSFGCDDERLEVALLVAGTCCVNETLATAWIEAALAASTVPIAVAANRAHLREEIDHARIGWAHLASLDDGLRAAIGACIERLIAANLPLWEGPDEFLPDEGVPGHGLPSAAAARATIDRAIRELVLPGFAHVGVQR
jgi:hypothetical protein